MHLQSLPPIIILSKPQPFGHFLPSSFHDLRLIIRVRQHKRKAVSKFFKSNIKLNSHIFYNIQIIQTPPHTNQFPRLHKLRNFLPQRRKIQNSLLRLNSELFSLNSHLSVDNFRVVFLQISPAICQSCELNFLSIFNPEFLPVQLVKSLI